MDVGEIINYKGQKVNIDNKKLIANLNKRYNDFIL
jgi:hypothetical protein